MRRLAAVVLLFEQIWPAIAPALGLIGAFACAALLDLPQSLPPMAQLMLLALTGLGTMALLLRGLWRVRRPRASEADRRLEQDSGLRHQPLAVLTDQPASGAGPLWAAHVARARAQLGRLRLRFPRPMLAAADPRALRALVLLGLIIGVMVAGPDGGSRLTSALRPTFAASVAAPAPLLQAWITPPGYTGLPPLFLKPEGGAATVPVGSVLTISLTGGTATPTLEQPGGSQDFPALDASSFQIEQELRVGGRRVVRRHGLEMAAWDLTVVEDAAPEVSFPDRPGQLGRGQTPQTRLPWQVSHAYGVTFLQAELHLVGRPEAPPLLVPIPLPGTAPKAAKGAKIEDLTTHPWAGLKVTAQLVARDAPGLEGRSAVANFTLPERRFLNRVARAVVAVRRLLSLAPGDRDAAVAAIDEISNLPQAWDDDLAGFLNLRAIAALLATNPNEASVAEAQDRLWTLALHLEEGAADRTARALEAARQQLHDALDAQQAQQARPDLDRRIQDLQNALRKRLDALAEQARRDPDSDGYDPDAHPREQRDMQRLTEEMRDAARNGDTDRARDRMAQLDKLLDALKGDRAAQGDKSERERERAEKRQRGAQQMSAVQDIIHREGGLLDHSEARIAPLETVRGLDPQTAAAPSQANADQRAADQRIQLALRRAVGVLMQDYADLTGKVPPNLGEADAAMREGAQALESGLDRVGSAADQRAIEALQKGGKAMRQQMASQFGRGQKQGDDSAGNDDQDGDDGMAQGDEDGEGDDGRQFGDGQGDQPGQNPGQSGKDRQHSRRQTQRDPLGRSRGEGGSGLDNADDVQVPEEMEQARTRALQEELRRRGADRTRSQDELDYIDRLLKQF